jgi:hypothetical protein
MIYVETELARLTLAELNYIVSAVNQYAEQGYEDWPAAVRLAFAHNRKLFSGQKYRARKAFERQFTQSPKKESRNP